MIQCLVKYGIRDDDAVTASVLDKVMIFESCIDALGNGDGTFEIVSTSSAYGHSIIIELLENTKEILLKLAQKVLSSLNNLYINDVSIITKYQEAIIDRFQATGKSVQHETYQYPDTKEYPRALKSTISAEKDIIRLHQDLLTDSSSSYSFRVNKLLQSFGKEVLGYAPDPNNLKNSVTDIVRKTVRGEMVTVQITCDTLRSYIQEISTYKRDKDDIQRTKKNIVEDYETLKRTYSKVTKDPMELAQNKVQQMSHPDKEALLSHEYQRFADIHMQMMRLFNGYITIYKTAFDVKLSELMAKIEDRKNVITEIITMSGMFAALNTKKADRNSKPIPFKAGPNV